MFVKVIVMIILMIRIILEDNVQQHVISINQQIIIVHNNVTIIQLKILQVVV